MMEVLPPAAALRDIASLAKSRQFTAAQDLASRVTKNYPQSATGWFLLGHIMRQQQNVAGARAATEKGLLIAPADKRLRLLSIELAAQAYEFKRALEELRALASAARRDCELLQKVGYLFTRFNQHAEAERCHRRALDANPANPQYLYDLTIPTIALGKLDHADSILNRLIAAEPQNTNAYFLRATLKKQTSSSNHVKTLEALLSRTQNNTMGEVELCYALAKELEDIGEHGRSFVALKRGADTRRRMLSYRVEDDIRAMENIASTFGSSFFARGIPGSTSAKPIFIVGMPRSGTTLVDRILSSHSQVQSIGEASYMHDVLTRATRSPNGKIDLAATINSDFVDIGDSYVGIVSAIAAEPARLIDKTPANFLYIGAIAKALPNATIIHMKRDPLDVCYAIYKTLLQNFPFSYDLTDLARYYLSYRKLMDHWNTVLPGRLIEVRYEDVVTKQASVTRQLIADCSLQWEDACLTPERNERASLTASASQIRRKVYSDSIGLWRAYEKELQPLLRQIQNGGVDVEGS